MQFTTLGTAQIAPEAEFAVPVKNSRRPEFAKLDTMPRHAVASGMVDLMLAPGDIPQVLIEYSHDSCVEAPRPETLEGPAQTGRDRV